MIRRKQIIALIALWIAIASLFAHNFVPHHHHVAGETSNHHVPQVENAHSCEHHKHVETEHFEHGYSKTEPCNDDHTCDDCVVHTNNLKTSESNYSHVLTGVTNHNQTYKVHTSKYALYGYALLLFHSERITVSGVRGPPTFNIL